MWNKVRSPVNYFEFTYIPALEVYCTLRSTEYAQQVKPFHIISVQLNEKKAVYRSYQAQFGAFANLYFYLDKFRIVWPTKKSSKKSLLLLLLYEVLFWIDCAINNTNMNPYYDPEWSILPPENNRRYVLLWNAHMNSANLPSAPATLRISSLKIKKNLFSSLKRHKWVFLLFTFMTIDKINFIWSWNIWCPNLYNWFIF